jgi:GNAT superfamily N-acetyltransferase
MKYRLAGKRDLPQLAAMRWSFQTENGMETPAVEKAEFIRNCVEHLRQCFKEGDWAFWITEQNGEIVSHVFVKKINSLPRPARIENFWGYVTNVYTKPAFRRMGIGSELLRRVKLWAVEQDFELLIVSPGEEAVSFYRREGFTEETDFYQLRLRKF